MKLYIIMDKGETNTFQYQCLATTAQGALTAFNFVVGIDPDNTGLCINDWHIYEVSNLQELQEAAKETYNFGSEDWDINEAINALKYIQ